MERKAQNAEAMTLQLQEDSRGKLYSAKPKYNEISDQLRTEAIQNSIATQRSLLQDSYKRGRVDLKDTAAVKAQALEFMTACEKAAVFPTMLAFSAALGLSRQRIYAFIRDNPSSETTVFLDQLRSGWAAIIAQASLAKQADPATSIFLLKNSGQGLTDKAELEVSQKPDSGLGFQTDEERQAALQKFIDEYKDEFPDD